MKKKDKEIIMHMRKGKRLNISKIARLLNLPVSTVSDRIRRIEKSYVTKHTPLLDYAKLGYLAHANLAIRIMHEKKHDFIDFLKEQDCVNSIYHVNSGFHLMVEVVFRNAIELRNWIEDTKKKFGLDITTIHVLKIEEKEGFMSK